MPVAYSLSKREILRGRKQIAELFEKGSTFFLYPFKVFYRCDPAAEGSQTLFVVSKKHIARAVQRNLVKRRMREAYRLNRPEGFAEISISAAIVYIAKTALPYREIEAKLKTVLFRLTTVRDHVHP
jgi:ribonuclease P protein component